MVELRSRGDRTAVPPAPRCRRHEDKAGCWSDRGALRPQAGAVIGCRCIRPAAGRGAFAPRYRLQRALIEANC